VAASSARSQLGALGGITVAATLQVSAAFGFARTSAAALALIAAAAWLFAPGDERRQMRGHTSMPLALLLIVLFALDQLWIPIGMRTGGLYLTSGSARFAPKRQLFLLGLAWITAALAYSVLVRGIALGRLSRWLGPLTGLLLVTVIDAGSRMAATWAVSDLDGADVWYAVLGLPLAGSLLCNSLYLRTGSLLAPALLDAALAFSERYLLCDARLRYLPIGYIVVGADWVYPMRLAGRMIPALPLVALAWAKLRPKGDSIHDEKPLEPA
jgi:hypothetical protein